MEEALIKRIMPNNLEAEQSVIGSMLMDREAIITAPEPSEGERCSGGTQQHGICGRAGDVCADFCKY